MNPPEKLEEEVICQCYQVDESTIRAAIAKENLTEIEQVTEVCEAGGGCHSCHILLQLFIDEHHKSITSKESLVEDHGQKIKKPGILDRFLDKVNPASS
tara:strand:- start:496 stop:792 length:297 start_codon:yes stop_codon:yes gene_type:complete